MNLDFKIFPVLTTNRLILRELSVSDGPALLRLRSDEQVNRYLDRPPTTTIEAAEAFADKIAQMVKNHHGLYWAICLKDEPELIGTICYFGLDAEKNMAETGYELMPQYQGQGLMNEALLKVLAYGFDTMGLKVIAALPHPNNESSVKLLKRNGFVLDDKNEFVLREDAGEQAVYILTR